MNKIKCYAQVEGGEWIEWPSTIKVNGNALKKRNKLAVDIGGMKVHALLDINGRIWDCINGWRQETGRPESKADISDDAINPVAQAYANRVWSGQSDTVPRNERIERVRKALEGQGFSMDGVVL